MSIMWSYLDKEKATIQVLEDYNSMVFNLKHAEERIQELQDQMIGIGSPNLDGLPKAHNPQAGEEKIINAVEKIDTLKEKHRQAEEYMAWFEPAWKELSEDEQYALDAFFISGDKNAADRCVDHFGIERNSVYRKRKRALAHLTLLLYGKE